MTSSNIPPPPPRAFVLGEFHFSVLGPGCAEEDFAAVTSSEAQLNALFGSGWSKGMTWERNYRDLERHAREFDEEIAFAWVIRDTARGYLGCAYLRPEGKAPGYGKVFLWLQASETRPERVSDLVGLFKDWMISGGYDPARYPVFTP